MCVPWPPDGPILGLQGPLWATPIVPGRTDLTGIFPLSGVSQPLRMCCLASHVGRPLCPLMAPTYWGYLFRLGGPEPSYGTGTSPTLESACATGWYLSDTCWRTCQLSTLIPSTLEPMTPGIRTRSATYVATEVLSS